MLITLQSIIFFLIVKSISAIEDDTSCATVCYLDYNPICAHNGKVHKTFSNKCELNRYNCLNSNETYTHKFNGECGKLEGLKCEHYCPLKSEPICGFNGNTHRQFTNLCYLERFNCLEGDVFVPRFNGDCWNYNCKESVCPYLYKPICAHDGVTHRTFSNECLLENYNCRRYFFRMTKKFDDECGELFEGKKCDEKCYHNSDKPVCALNGSNYEEFKNECELRQYICNNNYSNILKFNNGKCKK